MANTQSTHEELARHEDVKLGSDRSFGLVIGAACALVAGYQLWTSSATKPWQWWAGAAIVFAGLGVIAPRVLRPLNFVWFKFGLLLHHIVSPVILGLMFFVVFTPMALWMRLIRKRPLNLRFDRHTSSYWILRKPPGPPPGSFNNQF